MATRAEMLAASSIWAQLNDLDAALGDAAQTLTTPESCRPTLARARKIATRLRSLAEAADPDLTNIPYLNEVGNHLANVSTWVMNCSQGSDMSQTIDATLDTAPGWLLNLSSSVPGLAKGREQVTFVRQQAEAAVTDLSLRASGVEALLAVLVDEITARQNEILAVRSQVTATTDENAQVVASLRALVETEKTAALQKVDSDAKASLAVLDEATTKHAEDSEARLRIQVEAGQEILDRLSALEANINDMSQAVGDGLLTGDYGKYAHAEGRKADHLRLGAVAALIVSATVATWAAYSATTGNVTWQRLASKLAVTAVLAGLASYLASQSKEHREQERSARRRSLDLRALGPFIVDLPSDQQDAIRNALAMKSFLADVQKSSDGRSPRRGFTFDQFKSLLDTAVTIRR
jgi:hypothetical protein